MCEKEKMSRRWEVRSERREGEELRRSVARGSGRGGRPPQGGIPPPAKGSLGMGRPKTRWRRAHLGQRLVREGLWDHGQS